SLNTKITELSEKLSDSKTMLYHYKSGFQSASKDLDTLIGSQRSDKNKEGLGYSVVPPPPAQVYTPKKKDMSRTRLPEFADDTITYYRKSWPKKNFAHKNVTPRADLFKTASVSAARRVNTAAPRPNVNSARPKTTQDLVIILIQRVKRLERELKARTPLIKIHKVDVRGRSRSVMAWVPKKGNSGTKLEDSVRTKRSRENINAEVNAVD
nr:hypothetical protein [Tanacetum cinerariifolium]